MKTSLPFVLLLTACAMLNAKPISNGSGLDNVRGQRYGEIIAVKGGIFGLNGEVYNTLGCNDCPLDWWKSLKADEIKKELDARSVILNGPRVFLMDSISLAKPGPVRKFNGLEARLVADVELNPLIVLQGRQKPYKETAVERTTQYVFDAGRPVYELVSPKGVVYVMQSYSQITDPNLTEKDLAGLASRLKLPKGWEYRVRVPEEALYLRSQGTAYVVQDDLGNTYQRVDPAK